MKLQEFIDKLTKIRDDNPNQTHDVYVTMYNQEGNGCIGVVPVADLGDDGHGGIYLETTAKLGPINAESLFKDNEPLMHLVPNN